MATTDVERHVMGNISEEALSIESPCTRAGLSSYLTNNSIGERRAQVGCLVPKRPSPKREDAVSSSTHSPALLLLNCGAPLVMA